MGTGGGGEEEEEEEEEKVVIITRLERLKIKSKTGKKENAAARWPTGGKDAQRAETETHKSSPRARRKAHMPYK